MILYLFYVIIYFKSSIEFLQEKNKLSIIIPIYNFHQNLKKCLDTLINQTYNNLEIICLNDGSNSKSLEILKKYQKIDQRIIIKIEKKKISRNKGIKISNGDYITFLNSDNYLDLNVYEKCMEIIIKNNIDIVSYNISNIEKENNKFKKSLNEIFIYDFPYKNLDKKMYISVSNKIFKKQFIIDNHIYFKDDLIFGQEELFNLMTFSVSKKILFLSNFYCYKNNTNNKKMNIQKLLNDNIQKFKYLIEFFYAHNFFDRNDYLINFALESTYKYILLLNNSQKKYYAKKVLKVLKYSLVKEIKHISEQNIIILQKLNELSNKGNNSSRITYLYIFIFFIFIVMHIFNNKTNNNNIFILFQKICIIKK